MRPRRLRTSSFTILGAAALFGSALAAPAWALNVGTVVTLQSSTDIKADNIVAGSAALVPLMASEIQANQIATVATNTSTTAGAPVEVGKPMNDIAFIRVATETGRREVSAARDALPQLKNPELKRLAEMMVSDHNTADARLNKMAELKQWPVPGPAAPASQPSGSSASGDFDARWTAQMIDTHERAVALYRAQAAGGEDKDLRKYAHDTLPTIEQHLSELKSLQK